jgi:hypothetical protein
LNRHDEANNRFSQFCELAQNDTHDKGQMSRKVVNRSFLHICVSWKCLTTLFYSKITSQRLWTECYDIMVYNVK